jgi:hypothetical protein
MLNKCSVTSFIVRNKHISIVANALKEFGSTFTTDGTIWQALISETVVKFHPHLIDCKYSTKNST